MLLVLLLWLVGEIVVVNDDIKRGDHMKQGTTKDRQEK